MLITYEWIIGIGLMFSLAFIMNYISRNDFEGFIVFLVIFNAFVVWTGFLPLWTLILCIIILSILIISEIYKKRLS